MNLSQISYCALFDLFFLIIIIIILNFDLVSFGFFFFLLFVSDFQGKSYNLKQKNEFELR